MPAPTPLYALTPTEKQVSLYWRQSGGTWTPLPYETASWKPPRKGTPKTEQMMNGGYRNQVVVTEYDPRVPGEVNLYGVTPRASSVPFYDVVMGLNGGEAYTPTNATSGDVMVPLSVRCFDLREVVDESNSRGATYETIFIACEFQFDEPIQRDALKSTRKAKVICHGSITETIPA